MGFWAHSMSILVAQLKLLSSSKLEFQRLYFLVQVLIGTCLLPLSRLLERLTKLITAIAIF